jgi:hypothetical protein
MALLTPFGVVTTTSPVVAAPPMATEILVSDHAR